MVYETFQTKLTEKLTQLFGPDYLLLVQKIPKNNGVMQDGLCISRKNSPIAPAVYLNSYYELYQAGISIDEISEEIYLLYSQDCGLSYLDFSIINDFSKLRDKIACKLIHTDFNRELLKDIPSVPYLDLSIIFYLYLEENESGQMTALIHNHHMVQWNTSLEELYRLALENTPVLFPPDLKSMSQIMRDITNQNTNDRELDDFAKDLPKSQSLSPLYVLTNSSGINGASAILYPHVLRDFSRQLKQDLVIIPSSIHEVLLVPYDGHLSLDKLTDMVNQVNQTEVPIEEHLSNHVYYYSGEADQVLILQDSSAPQPC